MKNDQLIKRHEVKGTPFMIVETDKGCFIHMGAYRVSKIYGTVKECRNIIKIKPWDVIASIAMAAAHDVLNQHIANQNKTKHHDVQVPIQEPNVQEQK